MFLFFCQYSVITDTLTKISPETNIFIVALAYVQKFYFPPAFWYNFKNTKIYWNNTTGAGGHPAHTSKICCVDVNKKYFA